MKASEIVVGKIHRVIFKGKEVEAHVSEKVNDQKFLCKSVKDNKKFLTTPDKIKGLVKDDNAPPTNEGFSHYNIQWDAQKIHWSTTVKGMRFHGDWAKVDMEAVGRNEPYESVVNIRCNRSKSDQFCDTIPYSGDPRVNLKSLNADICAAITMWLHHHPFPGSTCAWCGCPDHQSNEPDKLCVDYQRKLIEKSRIYIRRVETIDRLIMKLKEFRDTAIRCGGTRGFEIKGDGAVSLACWLEVDLTAQAVLLKGKCPPLGSTDRIDDISGAEDSGEDDDVRPSVSSKSAGPASGNVADLVNRLKTSQDPAEKRKIRATLRRMGHSGGARSVGGGE